MTAITYAPVHDVWHDDPDTSTPVDAAGLEHIEAGIVAATGQANTALETAQAAVPGSALAAASGVATLDEDSKLTASQVPDLSAVYEAIGAAAAALAAAEAFASGLSANYDAAGAAAAAIASSVQRASNLSDLANAATARANLGLGSAATHASTDFATPASVAQLKGAMVFAEDYGAKGDARQVLDAAITTGTPTLTSATAAFTTADIGKSIGVAGAGAAGVTLNTTISAVPSPTTVTLATNAGTTVASARTVLGTDDTTAINNAVAAAYAFGRTVFGSNSARICFQARMYLCNTMPVAGGGGVTLGYSILPLPLPSSLTAKFALQYEGYGSAAYSHWLQTVPQLSGTVIITTLTAPASDGTYGDPSILGGPGPNYNGGGANDKFSNLFVSVSGMQLSAPFNPGWVGFDFQCVAEARVEKSSVIADIAVATGPPNLTVTPTNSSGVGLRMPKQSNNDISWVDDFTVEGFYYGIVLSEHFNAGRIGFLYVNTALYVNVSGAPVHGASIRYLGAEYCKTVLFAGGTQNSSQFPIHIGMMDCEQLIAGGNHVDDGRSVLYGEILWADYQKSAPVVNGGGNVRITNARVGHGAATAPTIPLTTVALLNPFWRDAAVYVNGGTVSAIKVDGVALGVTAGFVMVPSGKTIELDYTAAPTWVWTLL